MGGGRRSAQQFTAVDQTVDVATEGQGEARLRRAQSGHPRIHAVLHERLVLGLRSGVQILDRRRRRAVGQRQRFGINLHIHTFYVEFSLSVQLLSS